MSILLSGCSKDEFSRDLLCEKLRGDFSASADFIISNHNNNTLGKAEISKGDTTKILFTAPSDYEGISVTSSPSSQPDILSFEYSGIPAGIPKSISGELSLMFSLFSDTIPAEIEKLDKDAFTKLDEERCEVFFLKDSMSCKIIYDLSSGTPLSFEAGNDEISISLILQGHKYNQTQN